MHSDLARPYRNSDDIAGNKLTMVLLTGTKINICCGFFYSWGVKYDGDFKVVTGSYDKSVKVCTSKYTDFTVQVDV
jgi:hypothetical protein